MAFTYQKVEILGHVGKNPETKTIDGGKLVANFSVATTERYPGKSGEMIENTEWHNIVCFDRQAEIVRDYVKKGSKLFIVGKIKNRSWDDQESGKKMYRTDILIERLGLLDGKPAGEGSGDDKSASTEQAVDRVPY